MSLTIQGQVALVIEMATAFFEQLWPAELRA